MLSRSARRHTVGTTLAVALLLSACGGTADVTLSDPAPSVSESTPPNGIAEGEPNGPDPTVTETDVITDEPSEEFQDEGGMLAFEVSAFGIGPDATWGLTPADFSSALGLTFTALDYEVSDECTYVTIVEPGYDGIAFMVTGPADDARVTRADVYGDGAERFISSINVTVDSDRADIEANAGKDHTVEYAPHEYTDGQYAFVTPVDNDPGVAFVFELDTDGEVDNWRAGKRNEVSWVEGCL